MSGRVCVRRSMLNVECCNVSSLSMSEISKAYEPQSVEDKWYDFWLDAELLHRRTRVRQSPPIPSSSRRRMSPACSPWATSSTTPSRTSSPARRAWTARKCSGCPAPTTPASPRRPWWKHAARRQAKSGTATIWAARNFWSTSGNGRKNTAASSSSNSKSSARRAIGRANGSRWTRSIRAACNECSSIFTKRASSIAANAW